MTRIQPPRKSKRAGRPQAALNFGPDPTARTDVATLAREARRATGMTQEQFAVFIAVRRATVADWEAGRVYPGDTNWRILRAILAQIQTPPELSPRWAEH